MNRSDKRESLRIMDLGRADVRTGIAVSEAIFLSADHPATFSVFSPKRSCVSIGRFQISDVNFLPILKSENLGIVRRPRGGGLLLHTPLQIVFSSILGNTVDNGNRLVLNGVLMFLEQLGLTGRLDGFTGITVGGRRICEYTVSSWRGFTAIFGVLLVDVDYNLMSLLTSTRAELKHIEMRRLVGLVTCISNEIDEVPKPEAIRKTLASTISLSVGLRAFKGRLSLKERRGLASTMRLLASREWLNQHMLTHPSLFEESFRPKMAVFRSEPGLFRVALRASENKITTIGFSGSFMFYPEEKLSDLERNLNGCELSEAELLERISTFYLREGIRSPGISPMDIAYTILRATVET